MKFLNIVRNLFLKKYSLGYGLFLIFTAILFIFFLSVITLNFILSQDSSPTLTANSSDVYTPSHDVNLEIPLTTEEEFLVDELLEQETDIPKVTDIAINSNSSTTTTSTSNKEPYYIKINYGAQVVTIYGKDSNNDYTVPVKAMVCSTGTATPRYGGKTYTINTRSRWLALFGNVYGQYTTHIVDYIWFHSVPYLQNYNPGSLKYYEYDKLGTAASAGCIRLNIADAMWIYYNCGNGTKVEFYSSSNPGPLGKPSSINISSASDHLKNWDPTDPHPDNPWHNQTPSTPEPPQEPTIPDDVTDNNNSSTNNNTTNNSITDNTTSNNTTDNSVTDNSTSNNTTDNSVTNNTTSNNTTDNSVTNNTTSNNTTDNSVANNTTLNNATDNSVTDNTSTSNNTTNNVI